ncbi:MAG TPA: tetratricopeptide repeat protein [Pirellulales bacterium]|nr:tetratricopeptide repeat protein [Pirellulales bacterium]
MHTKKALIVSVTALSWMAASGCTSFPSFRQSSPANPIGVSQPNPMTKFANAVAGSSFGKSVSKALQVAKKKPAPKNDPTALAAGISPTRASDYVAMGENLEQNGDGEGARHMFRKALDLEPNNLGALIGLGRHFDRQGQLERAGEHYLAATKYHPKEAIAFNDLGLCYARQRRYDDAVKALSRAVGLEPDRALYRNNIAMVLVAQNRTSEALAHLTDAHGPAIAHYNIGYLLSKRGLKDAALEHFQQALEYNPAMEEAREWVVALTVPDRAGPEQAIASAPASVPGFASGEPSGTELQPESGLPQDRDVLAERAVSPRASTAARNVQPPPAGGGEALPTFVR